LGAAASSSGPLEIFGALDAEAAGALDLGALSSWALECVTALDAGALA